MSDKKRPRPYEKLFWIFYMFMIMILGVVLFGKAWLYKISASCLPWDSCYENVKKSSVKKCEPWQGCEDDDDKLTQKVEK